MKESKPEWVVIFKSKKKELFVEYEDMGQKMAALVETQPGFLRMNFFSNDLESITICYWDSLESIKAWRSNREHTEAITKGIELWYESYEMQVAKVEYSREFSSE